MYTKQKNLGGGTSSRRRSVQYDPPSADDGAVPFCPKLKVRAVRTLEEDPLLYFLREEEDGSSGVDTSGFLVEAGKDFPAERVQREKEEVEEQLICTRGSLKNISHHWLAKAEEKKVKLEVLWTEDPLTIACENLKLGQAYLFWWYQNWIFYPSWRNTLIRVSTVLVTCILSAC
ncbi:unnamed protein product [Cyprideis torosa]|uniref:Uncharacterized protein n=1 Tax=Cyprideis torosa TaxID=163714 RepID=A0A7R8ZJW6_9CRUS|nr:unnamed protein product [Cyprideis torosa]CAG0889436.1 unnamed protein product [Cyprideis torosa]